MRMDTKQLLKKLDEIEQSVRSIRQVVNAQVAATNPSLPRRSEKEIQAFIAEGRCLRCGEPLDGKVQRGVHERCYQKIRRDNVVDEALACGCLLPKQAPGPKSKPALLIVEKARAKQKSKRAGDE